MLTVEGMFDGQQIHLLAQVPFEKQTRVLITFLEERRLDAAADLDPIQALRGCAKHAGLTAALLRARQADLSRHIRETEPC